MSQADRIELRGIRVMGVHGLLEEERLRPQPFEIDLDVELDLAAAGRSDSMADTVDYGALADIAVTVVAGPHVDLMEHLAETIADAILAGPTGAGGRDLSPAGRPIEAVVVSVRKLRPPVPVHMAHAGVTLRRERSQGGSGGVT